MFVNWNQIEFAHIEFLALLIIPFGMIAWHFLRFPRQYATLTLPTLSGIKGHRKPVRGWIKQHLFILHALAMGLLIVALARPQTRFQEEDISVEAIDIILALDVSESMRAMDFSPNRLETAKAKALAFINSRNEDRLGLVIFGTDAFTQAPLTTDHEIVKNMLREIRFGLLDGGTAIGMGLSTAILRLKDSDAKSKVIILLTDGENNSGFIDPSTATEAAIQEGIKVYTIGVGRNGPVPFPMNTGFGNLEPKKQLIPLDEELLKEIAQRTGGKYYAVSNSEALSNVYQEINELEKTKRQVSRITRTTEEFHEFLILGGLLFILELLLRYVVVRHIP
ncbi:MAG: VWA domain-containing protein [Bacteroidota bacterium]